MGLRMRETAPPVRSQERAGIQRERLAKPVESFNESMFEPNQQFVWKLRKSRNQSEAWKRQESQIVKYEFNKATLP